MKTRWYNNTEVWFALGSWPSTCRLWLNAMPRQAT